jgi:flagellar biosynthesis GTPase FlhF
MADSSILQVEARADFAAIFGESEKAAASVENASARIKTAMASTSSAPEALTYSMRESREAIRGTGELLGTGMPRYISSFLASIGPIGSTMAAAFSGVAIVGIAELLYKGSAAAWNFYENTVNLKSELEALDSIERKLSDDTIAMSNALIQGNVRLTELSAGAIAGDRERVASLGMQITDLGKVIDVNGKQWKDLGDNAKRTLKEFLVPTQAKDLAATLKEVGFTIEHVQKILGGTDEDTTEFRSWQEALRGLSDLYNTVALKVQKYNQEIAIANVEAQNAIRAEQEKTQRQAEQAARAAQRIKHEEIIAELDDAEKAAKENTRVLEEEVRANREANKEMDHAAEEAAKATERAWEKAWEAIVKAQNKANEEQKKKLKEMQEQWNHMFAPINRAMDQIVDGMLRGTMTIGKAFADMGRAIVMDVVNSLLKALEAQIEYSITAGAIGKEHAMGGIMRDAYKAASNVYAEVPFPFNLVAAPAMFATVVALGGGLPSAAGGWDVPATGGFALLHPNEMVLPSHLAANVREGAGGSAVHLHVHALDATGVSDFFERNGDKIARTLRRGMRKGNSF